jgi:repressor LexA
MRNLDKLSIRQHDVLYFIAKFHSKNSFPPTIREISNSFGWTGPKAAHDHVRALIRKGYIQSRDGQPRTITITQKGKDALREDQ